MIGGDITIPKVGSVPKAVVIPIAAVGLGYVGWRYYQSRQTAASDATSTISDGAFGAVDSSIPGVVGAVSPTNSYGGDTGATGDTSNGQHGTTDAAWTNDVVTAFASAGSTTSGDDVLEALGKYLSNQPMTDAQKSIVQRAIAVAGYPYGSGAHTIVSGGNTALTVAPSGLKVDAVTQGTVHISFTPVPGATEYRAFRGVGVNVGASHGSPITIGGLQPSTSYTVTIQGLTASGVYSPSSAPITFKTAGYTLSKPATPTVSSIGKDSAVVKTVAVAHADGYRWWVNGVSHGYSEAPSYTLSSLKPNTKYTVTVAADLAHQNPGPTSAGRQFTTKK